MSMFKPKEVVGTVMAIKKFGIKILGTNGENYGIPKNSETEDLEECNVVIIKHVSNNSITGCGYEAEFIRKANL